MLTDVEEILDCWEHTGMLQDCVDPLNCAIILETQRKVNESLECSEQFQRVSITAALNIARRYPDQFQGLIDYKECKDVYRLGVMPRGLDSDVCVELVQRVLQLGAKCLYFGGLVERNGYVYLVGDPVADH